MDGKDFFGYVKAAIPGRFANAVRNERYVRNGRVYERIVEKILQNNFPHDLLTHPEVVFPVDREGRRGGYLKPDLLFRERTYIEVTGWADSNMLFSKIFQGLLLKQARPGALYYVVIPDLGLDDGWSNDDRTLWCKWGRQGGRQAVDGWFGFVELRRMIQVLRSAP